MKDIKLIVSDIDECITPFYLSPVDWQATGKLQELCQSMCQNDDLPFIIFSSGRQVPYAEMVVQNLGAFSDYPSFLEAGAIIYYPKTRKTIFNPEISEETLNAFVKIDPLVRHLIKKGANKEAGKELCISLNPPFQQSIEDFYQEVLKEIGSFGEWLSMFHSKTAVDITPRGIDKGSAIRVLEQMTPFNREQMLSIGDTAGDLPMMRLTRFVACPDNAVSSVKELVREKGGYISSYPETKGIVDILEKLIFYG